MRTPVHTGQFRRDTRRAQKRGKDITKLRDILGILLAAKPLPPRAKDHPLTGEFGGYRTCHIEPDWLLIYKIEGEELILARTGIHADLLR